MRSFSRSWAVCAHFHLIRLVQRVEALPETPPAARRRAGRLGMEYGVDDLLVNLSGLPGIKRAL